MISAHEANAQRVQAVGSSRETHPKKRNPRNEPMKCNRRDAFVRLRILAFYVGGVSQQFGYILIGEKLDSKLVR